MARLLIVFIYCLCAVVYVALAVQAGLRPAGRALRRAAVFGCLGTALWSVCGGVALAGPMPWQVLVKFSETLRTIAWLVLLLKLLQSIDLQKDAGPRRILTTRVVLPGAALFIALVLAPFLPLPAGLASLLMPLSLSASIVMAVLGLWLLETVLARSGPSGRWGLKYGCLGLATVFVFDLFFFADALLLRRFAADLMVVRSFVALLVAPLLAVSIRRMKSWAREGDANLNLSPKPVFQGVALVGSGLYLLAMAGIATLIRELGGAWGNSLQITFLIAGLLLMVVVVGSGRVKSQIKVWVHKYFFTYKFDYREEWRRFIGMMSAHQPLSLGERIVHAVADMMDSPAAALWIWQSADDAFVPDAEWNYRGVRPSEHGNSAFVAFLRRTGWIVEMDGVRDGAADYADLVLPPWLADHSELWLIVPLVHRGGVLGFLALDRARAPRPLDWEDRDLLKTVAAHAASYLAEELAAEALSDAQRMEEFNRRFAFVVHDIKNVVGQMSLMLQNAERYGDNPEFRQDMMQTVSNSVTRMKALLDQLSEKRRQPEESRDIIDLRGVVIAAAERWQKAGGTILADLPDGAFAARAIESNMVAVLDLLIDNALGAAGAGGAVTLRLCRRDEKAVLEVQDDGPGMDADFVRKELFRPLRSTKSSGYGIGAYQTRHLIHEMGGQLEVDTAPNRGTSMRILLPLAAS